MHETNTTFLGKGSQRRKRNAVTTPNRQSAEFFCGCHNAEMRVVTLPKGGLPIDGLAVTNISPTYI